MQEELKHWTDDYVMEVAEGTGTVYEFYNENGEMIGSRVNRLMAQVALLDYAANNIDTYVNNPVNYLISLKKLITVYDKRYNAMLNTGEVMNTEIIEGNE